jgi:hypothetical protein
LCANSPSPQTPPAPTTAGEDPIFEAERVAQRDFDKVFFQAILETATGSIDRSRVSADLVQKAAAAVGTLYAGVIGVAFSVSERPITARAILPVLFLGLAIGCSMIYVAYLTPGRAIPASLAFHSVRTTRMRNEVNFYMAMVRDLINRRAYFLRSSVLALAVGVVLLPAAFITGPVVAEPELPDWPAVPQVDNPAQATLEAVSLQARVDEVAAERSGATATEPNWPGWAWWALGIGLAVTFLTPPFVKLCSWLARKLTA